MTDFNFKRDMCIYIGIIDRGRDRKTDTCIWLSMVKRMVLDPLKYQS